jgi:hypothetical protein
VTVFVVYQDPGDWLSTDTVHVFSTLEKADAYIAHKEATEDPLREPWIEEGIVDDEEVKRDEG